LRHNSVRLAVDVGYHGSFIIEHAHY
jgi:hypothetical protein